MPFQMVSACLQRVNGPVLEVRVQIGNEHGMDRRGAEIFTKSYAPFLRAVADHSQCIRSFFFDFSGESSDISLKMMTDLISDLWA